MKLIILITFLFIPFNDLSAEVTGYIGFNTKIKIPLNTISLKNRFLDFINDNNLQKDCYQILTDENHLQYQFGSFYSGPISPLVSYEIGLNYSNISYTATSKKREYIPSKNENGDIISTYGKFTQEVELNTLTNTVYLNINLINFKASIGVLNYIPLNHSFYSYFEIYDQNDNRLILQSPDKYPEIELIENGKKQQLISNQEDSFTKVKTAFLFRFAYELPLWE